jgi:phosphoribosylanthranilate isomerase
MMRWKVCGMRDLSNIQEVAALGPDFMGFIWAAKSPRYVGPDFVIPALPAKTKAVGVFVNETTDNIIALSEKAGFSFVQLHGEESQKEIEALQAAGLQVIKAISVGEKVDLDLKDTPDFYLFDTKKGTQVGGTGEHFDWSLLAHYCLDIPYFLAGGLQVEDVQKVKNFPGLYALDFNSKLEVSPGLKDVEKVKELVKQQ